MGQKAMQKHAVPNRWESESMGKYKDKDASQKENLAAEMKDARESNQALTWTSSIHFGGDQERWTSDPLRGQTQSSASKGGLARPPPNAQHHIMQQRYDVVTGRKARPPSARDTWALQSSDAITGFRNAKDPNTLKAFHYSYVTSRFS